MTSKRLIGAALAMAATIALWTGATTAQAAEFNIVRSSRVIWWADLAYDSVNAKFLVVWVTEEAVFGQFINPAGTMSGAAFTISAGKGNYYPRVAFGGGQFIVVYSYALGNGQGIDYRARFVTYGQPPVLEKPVVIDNPVRFTQPGAVAYVKADDYFVVVYPKKKGTMLTKVFPDGSTAQSQQVTDLDSTCGMNAPDIAVNTNKATGENTALVTGWRDPTSPGCQSGIWYRFGGADGFPTSDSGFAVERGGISREQRAAFNPKSKRYLLEWSQRPSGVVQGIVRGRQFGLQQPAGAAYDLQKPITNDADFGNNGFGEGGLAYEPSTNKFLLTMRGADKAGAAPIWKKQIGADGTPVPGSLAKLTNSVSTAPWPLAMPDGRGKVLTIYRGFFKINGMVLPAAAWPEPPPK